MLGQGAAGAPASCQRDEELVLGDDARALEQRADMIGHEPSFAVRRVRGKLRA